MQNSNAMKSPAKKNKNYQLSKQAIKYLDNQIINDGEKKIIEAEFIFQVVYSMKKLDNWYCCSLIDQNSKYGGFCIKYKKRYGVPKEGDIIKTRKIEIVKLPNRDTNIYFCDKVKKVEESKKMIVDPKNVDSITKVRSTSRKQAYMKYNIFKNYEGDNEINHNMNSPTQNKYPLLGKNILSDSKNVNLSQKKPTLVSELTSFVNNPVFILKFLAKTEMKQFASRYNLDGFDFVQNYIFSDINGDKIQAVSFNYDKNEELDKYLKVNSIYRISKAAKKTKFSKDFSCTNGDIQLLFNSFTKVEELSEEETKGQIFKDKIQLTKISEIINGQNKIFDICGIVLEDKGIIEKKRAKGEVVKYRRLIIGDDTLYKVNLKLWEEKIDKDILYLKGDIICAKDVKYKQWINYYELNSLFLTTISHFGDTKKGKALKKFYQNHQKIEEYNDITFVELNKRNDIQNILIKDFLIDYDLEMKKITGINSNKLAKINGIVVGIEHGDANVFSGCKYCYKKFDDMCPQCKTYNKKLYFDFHVKIADCSGYMWIQLFGESAENFLGISPEEYQTLIKHNNKHKIEKLNKRILYQEFTFIGKYIILTNNESKNVKFSIVQYKKVDKKKKKKLIQSIKDS